MLWCRTLGELALYADEAGTRRLMGAGKPLAVLAYLALCPARTEARDRLAELFWPGVQPSRARHDLRQALHRLKLACGGQVLLEASGTSIALVGRVTFDCLEGERALAVGDLDRARRLLRGGFFETFTVRGGREFEEWVESQRARFRGLYAAAAAGLVERLVVDGRPTEAVPIAEELVATNPLDEGGVGLLMTALARAGQVEQALGQYRAHAALLGVDGDEPSADLRALAATLAHGNSADHIDRWSPGPPQARNAPAGVRRPWLVAALLTAVLAVATGVTLQLRAAPETYAQGTIYLASTPSGAESAAGRLARVIWTRADAAPEPVAVSPWPAALPPALVRVAHRVGNDLHTNLARVSGADTIQLTAGPYDDNDPQWAPDRCCLAFTRGYGTAAGYEEHVFVANSSGDGLRQITVGPFQNRLLQWSPDGTGLLFQRASPSPATLWIADVDGAELRDLSPLFPPAEGTQWNAAFSPDGDRVAAVRSDENGIHLANLRDWTVSRISAACRLIAEPLLWSPDGRWLAIGCWIGAGRTVSVIPADGSRAAVAVARLPIGGWTGLTWLGGMSHYVHAVVLRADTTRVEAGSGARLGTTAFDIRGAERAPRIRWSVDDMSVAVIDSGGFVRGLRAGTARVIASAGGFRADTGLVVVTPASVDTLLMERWTRGIDTLRWRVFGFPAPRLVPASGPGGDSALLSNGDRNWPSGVVSRSEVDLTAGVTVEVPVRFQATGLHWQEMEIALVPVDLAVLDGERNIQTWLAGWWATGPSPEYATPVYSCGSQQVSTKPAGGTWTLDEMNAGWHRFVIQVRSDWLVECLLDGELVGTFTVPPVQRVPRAALLLGGRTHETTILHGPVLVTKGLRF